MAILNRHSGSRQWTELYLDFAGSEARTAPGTGEEHDFNATLAGVVPLEVSGVWGTGPKLDVKIVELDGDKTCEFGEFAQQTAPNTAPLSVGMPIPTPKKPMEQVSSHPFARCAGPSIPRMPCASFRAGAPRRQ